MITQFGRDPKRPVTFTIGQTSSYLKRMAECLSFDKLLLKRGMHNNCPGGIVFQTSINAKRYINERLSRNKEKYSVFEIDADWEHDCYEQTDLFNSCYWKYLINDKPIVCLVEDT